MIKFLLKGIIGDSSRSLLPIVIITIGVTLTIVLSGMLRGIMGDMIDQNARFDTGHVKIMTKAYAENIAQVPNDLALLDVGEMKKNLIQEYPNMEWVERIKFGGLIDVPDTSFESGSKGQGPAMGFAYDLFSKESKEIERLNIKSSIVKGKLPSKAGEVLIGDQLADNLHIELGDEVTYMGSTMNGSMTFENFIVSGTVKFGMAAMDKGVIVLDTSDVKKVLDMEDAVGELLGYLPGAVYNDEDAQELVESFNLKNANPSDEFAPVMLSLKEQNGLASYIDYVDYFAAIFVGVFVFAMSIVLWNTGLLGGLRRYKEFGIRLALGETKGHIYTTLIYEAALIGFVGSIIGTLIGLAGVYYLQQNGIDYGDELKGSTMLMPTIMRAKFSADLLYIGFIPGFLQWCSGICCQGLVFTNEVRLVYLKI